MLNYTRISKDDLYNRLKDLEPFNLVAHHDADGVYSAVLLSKLFKIDSVYFPEIFGEYDDEQQVAVDIGQPMFEDWEGICFDHHPHDNVENMKYSLIEGNMPTGGVVLEALKEHIPEEYSWLAAGAYVGDGQAALIPPEVFERHPSLLETRASIYQSYGKTNIYEYNLYTLLSSPINAVCRTGNPYQSYMILKACREPDDVISHPVLRDAQNTLTTEYNSIIGEYGKDKSVRRSAMMIGNFMVMTIDSKYRIASRVATAVGTEVKNKTVIVVNEQNGALSIRGDLAYWLLKKMVPIGWKMGGHAGYCGGSLLKNGEESTVTEFLKDLRSVCY